MTKAVVVGQGLPVGVHKGDRLEEHATDHEVEPFHQSRPGFKASARDEVLM
jgi:hypothetical protein